MKQVTTRSKAQDLIKRGLVSVNGKIVRKPAHAVDANDKIEILAEKIYVSRAAHKLLTALEKFNISVKGKICLDIGSSTGGFTQVLLEKGARKIYAVDVGTGQLHPSLRDNPKIILLENTDARHLCPTLVPDKINFFASDVSFISITKILPHITQLFYKGTEGVILIKPQFELSAELVGKGVIHSEHLHRLAIENVQKALAKHGFSFINLTFSPITGTKGNIEFLAHIIYLNGVKPRQLTAQQISQAVAQAHQYFSEKNH